MKVKGLDNKTYSWYLVDYQPMANDTRIRSELHLDVRKIIKEVYPSYRLCEEVPLPGSGGLFADFYLPQLKIIVEAHGKQHYQYVQHFHKNWKGFIESKKRDEKKAEWCKINNITLIICSYWEKKNVWKERLQLSFS